MHILSFLFARVCNSFELTNRPILNFKTVVKTGFCCLEYISAMIQM
jgi:hypothetical protein